MQQLSLIATSKATLTKTDFVPDAKNPGARTATSYRCGLKGEALQGQGLPIYKDAFTGNTYVRVAENIPSATDTVSQAAAAAIYALDPIFYVSPSGDIKGWFIEAPYYNDPTK